MENSELLRIESTIHRLKGIEKLIHLHLIEEDQSRLREKLQVDLKMLRETIRLLEEIIT